MYSLQCELRGKAWQTLSNTLMAIFNGIYCIYFLFLIREGKFFIERGGGGGGGGWAGASEERVLSKFFTNWGGSNLFNSQPGEGHSFFW